MQLVNKTKSYIIDGPGSPEDLYLISLLEPARTVAPDISRAADAQQSASEDKRIPFGESDLRREQAGTGNRYG